MRFRTFDWDQWNVDHLARHGLEPYEVEVTCRTSPLILRGREGCHLVYGRTSAGRYVFIALRALQGGAARIITARDMTAAERRFYHRRH